MRGWNSEQDMRWTLLGAGWVMGPDAVPPFNPCRLESSAALGAGPVVERMTDRGWIQWIDLGNWVPSAGDGHLSIVAQRGVMGRAKRPIMGRTCWWVWE